MLHVVEHELGAGVTDDLRQAGRDAFEDHRAARAAAGGKSLLYGIVSHIFHRSSARISSADKIVRVFCTAPSARGRRKPAAAYPGRGSRDRFSAQRKGARIREPPRHVTALRRSSERINRNDKAYLPPEAAPPERAAPLDRAAPDALDGTVIEPLGAFAAPALPAFPLESVAFGAAALPAAALSHAVPLLPKMPPAPPELGAMPPFNPAELPRRRRHQCRLERRCPQSSLLR